jgi:hypothetical protein
MGISECALRKAESESRESHCSVFALWVKGFRRRLYRFERQVAASEEWAAESEFDFLPPKRAE